MSEWLLFFRDGYAWESDCFFVTIMPGRAIAFSWRFCPRERLLFRDDDGWSEDCFFVTIIPESSIAFSWRLCLRVLFLFRHDYAWEFCCFFVTILRGEECVNGVTINSVHSTMNGRTVRPRARSTVVRSRGLCQRPQPQPFALMVGASQLETSRGAEWGNDDETVELVDDVTQGRGWLWARSEFTLCNEWLFGGLTQYTDCSHFCSLLILSCRLLSVLVLLKCCVSCTVVTDGYNVWV